MKVSVNFLWGSALILAIIAIWLGYASMISATMPKSLANQGLYGDSFGALNALFSGLAFAGVIITIFLQIQELKAQRKEFDRQRFETNFFNITALRLRQLEAMKYDSGSNKEYVGNKLFDFIVDLIRDDFGKLEFKGDNIERMQEKHRARCRAMPHQLRQYLGFCSLLKFVDDAAISIEDKNSFIKIDLFPYYWKRKDIP